MVPDATMSIATTAFRKNENRERILISEEEIKSSFLQSWMPLVNLTVKMRPGVGVKLLICT